MSDERHPEAALAQATLAGRSGDYGDAIGWCLIALLDYRAMASEEQIGALKTRTLQTLDAELKRREET